MTDAPPLKCLSSADEKHAIQRDHLGTVLDRTTWGQFTDAESRDLQLASWVEGVPLHDLKTQECCPDFSCCRAELLAERRTREAFRNGDDDTRYQMLGMFLGAALADYAAGDSIYVAGVDDPSAETNN